MYVGEIVCKVLYGLCKCSVTDRKVFVRLLYVFGRLRICCRDCKEHLSPNRIFMPSSKTDCSPNTNKSFTVHPFFEHRIKRFIPKPNKTQKETSMANTTQKLECVRGMCKSFRSISNITSNKTDSCEQNIEQTKALSKSNKTMY